MARSLIVIGEPFAGMADLDNPPVESNVFRGMKLVGFRDRSLPVCGSQRLTGEHHQNVSQQEFLMLLFVVDPQFDDIERLVVGMIAGQKGVQRLIDMGSVGAHVVGAGAREQAATRARVPLALAFIVGVETVGVIFIEERVVGIQLRQQKCLEEPGRVSQMPFGRARVVHGLDNLVFVTQRLCQR